MSSNEPICVNSTIPRINFADDPFSFESLRREGIGYVQQLCGTTWTDYNTHDPGVTILEQLCYGLTDIMYRTDFDVADYLVDPNSKLDLSRLALQRPQAILPARPTTIADYHHAILDAVEEVEQVWISPCLSESQSVPQGLYQMKLRLSKVANETSQRNPNYADKIINKVNHVYGRVRNLAEDVDQIIIIPQDSYQLESDIEIDGLGDAPEILANVYFTSMQFLTGKLAVLGYEEQKNAGLRLDQILNGPLLLHGNYLKSQVPDDNSSKHLEALYTQLMTIEGVSRVNQLRLIAADPAKTVDVANPIINGQARLKMPQSQDEIFVALKRNDYAMTVPFGILNNRFSQQEFKQDSMRHTRQDFSTLFPLPLGDYRDLDYYYSIQNHFPPTYRLNGKGMSALKNDLERAQIRQLRGYLVIFEQFMANFGANLQSLNQLFSLDCEPHKTYHFHLLDNKTIEGVEHLYPASPQDRFDTIISQFDHFYDRKGRVLDYLLALYGESLDQQIVRDFNYYYSDERLRKRLLINKRDYLKSIVTLGKDRGSGFDVSKIVLSATNISGLQARLHYQLGFTQCSQWPYTKEISSKSLKVLSDKDFAKQCATAQLVAVSDKSSLLMRSLDIPLKHMDEKAYQQQIGDILQQFSVLREGIIGVSFFTGGLDISRYKMVKSRHKRGYALYFRAKVAAKQKPDTKVSKQSETWLYLGHSSSVKVVIVWANLLRRRLTDLNHNAENLYVVEHLLLRPQNSTKSEETDTETVSKTDFFSFQLSLIFPAYTARCRDPGYQAQAQIIARENCPAHLLASFLWLEYEQMVEFEQLYQDWLECRRLETTPSEACFEAAGKLVVWLKAQHS